MSDVPHNANENRDEETESSSAFVRSRRPADDEVDMTPMIDCVFLLLIFFIVSFTADQTKAVPLPHAKYGNPVLGSDSVFITIMSDEGNTAQVYLADEANPSLRIKSTNLIDREQEIIDYVRAAVSGPAGKKHVVIKGDGKVSAGQVALVAKAAGQAVDGQSIHISVLGKK